jgi:hypothetical protein
MKIDLKINWRILIHILVFVLFASSLFPTITAAVNPVEKIQKQTGNSVAETLKAEDKDGLPVPANYTDYSGESGPYLHSITLASPSSLKTVLGFYRNELKSRKWRELPGATGAGENKAALTFDNNQKDRLVLKLARNAAGGTDIKITVKSEGAAKKDGILPAPGMVRIYLGNATDGQVVFTIAQKKIAVKKHSTSENSMKDAPFIDVKPGKYPFTLSGTGPTPVKDSIEVGPDETWGLIAGPGGAMPLQMF